MSRLGDALARALTEQGSTRTAALMRVALVGTIWSRLAFGVRPIRDLFNVEHWLLSAAFFVFTPLLLLGYRTRLAAVGNALTMLVLYYWFGHYRGEEPWTHHHIYTLVISSVLLVLTPCGGSWSIDRYLAVREAERLGVAPPPERGPTYGLLLFQIQLTAMYFWTAVDKSYWAFFNGERMEMIFLALYFGSDYPKIPGFRALTFLGGAGTILLEYALAVLPWFRRFRAPILIVGAVFHGLLYVLLPVSTYTFTMLTMYIAWIPPDAFHRLLDRIQSPANAS